MRLLRSLAIGRCSHTTVCSALAPPQSLYSPAFVHLVTIVCEKPGLEWALAGDDPAYEVHDAG